MDDNQVAGKVSYEQDGIFIHVCKPDDDTLLNGKLSVIEKPRGNFVEWYQTEETDYSLEQVHEWSMVNTTVGYHSDKQANKDNDGKSGTTKQHPISVEFSELKSIKCSQPEQGWSHVTLMLKDGTTHPAMHFHMGDVNHFMDAVRKFVRLKQSPREPNLWIVIDPQVEALERSFNELQLFGERKNRIVSKFFQDPYTTTLSGFSKVTKFLYDYVVHDGTQLSSRPDNESDLSKIFEELEQLPGLEVNHQEEPGYEVITRNDLIPRPHPSRETPLTAEEWAKHVDPDGRILAVDDVKRRVFKGGVAPSLRSEVWKFILGCYKFDSTFKERQEVKKKKVDDYYRMKLQWKTMSDDQEQRFSDLRDRKSLIEKDVSRTDRNLPFFEGENNENVQILYDLLMTYCMYNFDLGYVQGMSDLLAPILVVMENEVDAFWAFVAFMDRVGHNFEMDQLGMKTQLQQLYTLLHFIDPQLCDYLESHDSGNLYFCFRWLLIIFKREFKFPEIMRLWEVLWTDLPCKNFHLLFSLAVLDTEKNTLMENKFGFTEILKHINDMSQRIKLEDNLVKAEGMYQQLSACHYLPQNIRDILGIAPLPLPPGSDSPSPSLKSASSSSTSMPPPPSRPPPPKPARKSASSSTANGDVVTSSPSSAAYVSGVAAAAAAGAAAASAASNGAASRRDVTETDGGHAPIVTPSNGVSANKSPQSNSSSLETSSIELISDVESELRYQTSLDLTYM